MTIFLAENHLPSFCNWATLAKTVASLRPVTADGDGATGVVGFEAWSRDDFLEGESGRETTTGEFVSTGNLKPQSCNDHHSSTKYAATMPNSPYNPIEVLGKASCKRTTRVKT